VVDPDAGAPVPAAEIQKALELTPAEARLAAALADGTALKEAAAALGVTYTTARTQLRNIFSKTGVHRQGELVRLLGNIVLARPGDNRRVTAK
jgi:DNA-binding CsgD family transcriptional regulator